MLLDLPPDSIFCLFSHLIYLEHLFHKLRHVIFTKITDVCNGHFGGVACNKAAVDLNRASKLAIWRRVQIIWVWVNTYRYIFCGMNIHLPAILGFTRYQGFDPSPFQPNKNPKSVDFVQLVQFPRPRKPSKPLRSTETFGRPSRSVTD